MIRATCPGCGRECEFADFLAGLTAVCKNCSHRIPVPASRPQASRPEKAIQSASGAAPPAPDASPAHRPSGDAIRAAPGVKPAPPTPAAPLGPLEGSFLVTPSLENSPKHSAPLPDGAAERVEELLPTGVSAPQLERELVGQGYSPEAAAAVVDKLLEERVRQQFHPLEQTDRHRRVHGLLSVAVGGACVLLAYWFFGTWPACRTFLNVLLPLACIWFPDEMGGYVRTFASRGPSVPGVFIRYCAWLVLTLLVLRVLWLGLTLPAGADAGPIWPPR